ncbi:hypothetical protein CEXT_6911 [Caerostris extrusa]|uniref:Uncharacterized protein n=1 Tax=Caerostris extrusa TaxID=172846 RepID=A0AAV4ULZ9_CAEEX|nr:hypothetical protein CEXT_6911 [Caerostris extrusa]
MSWELSWLPPEICTGLGIGRECLDRTTKRFKGFSVSDKKILRAEQQGLVSNSFLHRDNKRMFILNCFVQEDFVSRVGQISFWRWISNGERISRGNCLISYELFIIRRIASPREDIVSGIGQISFWRSIRMGRELAEEIV